MGTLLIASQNRGKIAEIKALLAGELLELVTADEVGISLTVEENGQSYHQNAAIKAKAYTHAAGLVSLADDSGLEVDALGGQPGIRSARFSPQPGATDADRRFHLLQQLATHPRPWQARFRCVVAIACPPDSVFYTEGLCEGEIIPDEHGEGGFGYDPIFWLPYLHQTMAELDMLHKNQISHRAHAVRKAIPLLRELLNNPKKS
jgi:XTP/dITP diphosphohydrolase